MDERVKLILAEDQKLMRKSLISLLKEFPKVEVVGEAGNGKELLDLLKHVQADLLLLDLEMPIMNGIQALEIINIRYPQIKVVILSMHHEAMLVCDLLTRGAKGYLPKDCDVNTLITTIMAIHKDGYYHTEAISKALLTGLIKEKSINPHFDELALSEREIEILKELCLGKTNKEVALLLNITARTVDFHRGNIYSKTKSRNIAELVKYSIKNGIINVG
jgi:two-component system response regulator DegU